MNPKPTDNCVRCGRRGTMIPEVMMWAVGRAEADHDPLRVQIGASHCEDCAALATVEDFVTESLWRRAACAVIMSCGGEIPSRRTARIRWVGVGHAGEMAPPLIDGWPIHEESSP